MVAHTFNPSTWKAEADGSLWVWGLPGLQELAPGQAPKLQRNPVSKGSGIFTLEFSDYSGAAESESPNKNHANGQKLN